MSERKRRGPITLFCESRSFRWATLLVVMATVVYPISYGPALWFASRDLLPERTHRPFDWFYAPLQRIAYQGGPAVLRVPYAS